MLRVKAQRGALFIIFLLPFQGWAQQLEAPGFEVKYEAQTVTIHVTRTSLLSELLETLCQTTNSQCDGTRAASESLVGPMTLIGPWQEVVTSLLDGTQLNYSSMAPSSSRPGSLIIQGAMSQVSPPVNSPAPFKTVVGQGTGSSAPTISSSSDDNSNDASRNVAASATGSSADAITNTAPFSAETGRGIADSYGLPVVISNGPAIEAMPDRTGNPIPVDSGGPLIEPMHDKNGRPIPVMIESQSYEPMPDKSGNLIPVNVVRRH